jgi:hypothetical protein
MARISGGDQHGKKIHPRAGFGAHQRRRAAGQVIAPGAITSNLTAFSSRGKRVSSHDGQNPTSQVISRDSALHVSIIGAGPPNGLFALAIADRRLASVFR